MSDPGQFDVVVSLAGHDKGSLYLILKTEGERFLLVNGKTRTLDKPKYKNRKHLRRVSINTDAPASDKQVRSTLAQAAHAANEEGDKLGER